MSTMHTASATMAEAHYARVSEVPVWLDNFVPVSLGWTNLTTVTTTRVLNSRTGLPEMSMVSTDASTPYSAIITRSATGLTVGKLYRVEAQVYAASSFVQAYLGHEVIVPAYTSVGTKTQRLVGEVFTASATTKSIRIQTNSTAAAPSLRVQLVSVYEVESLATLDLRPTQAQVTLDESWSPYARAVIECPIPPMDVLDKIDPREEKRVAITLTETNPEVAPVVTTRTNLMTNPSFETNTTGWVQAGSTATLARTTAQAAVGAASMSMTAVTTGPQCFSPAVPVAVSSPYVAQIRVRTTTTRDVILRVQRNTAAAPTTWTSAGDVTVSCTAGVWTLLANPQTTPSNAYQVRVNILTPASVTIGEVMYLDSVMIEAGATTGTYFDGSTAAGSGTTYAWTGTAHASSSTATTTSPGTPTLLTSRTFNLGLRARNLDYVNGVMTLELSGDEILLQDYLRFNNFGGPTPPATTSLKTLVNWALSTAHMSSLHASSLDATIASADVVWDMAQSLWDFLNPFVTNAGYRLWCDEARVWHLDLPLDGSSGTAVIGSLTALDDNLSREEWGHTVTVGYVRTDPSTGTTSTQWGSYVTSQPSGADTTKSVIVMMRAKSTPTSTGPLLARIEGRGRRVGATAINDYSVVPGLTAYLSTPITNIQPVLVSAVAWDFPSDEMTITTRDLP